MAPTIRRATRSDAKHIALLLTELGYPATAGDAQDRLALALKRDTGRCLVAQSAAEVIGMVAAELVPYFPDGSVVCRVTALVVSSRHRGRGVGAELLAAIGDFAREHHCSGIELTSGQHRIDAHRFYERLGFSKTSFRFFRAL